MLRLTISDEHENGNISVLEYQTGLEFRENGLEQVENFLSIKNGKVVIIWREYQPDYTYNLTSSKDDFCDDFDQDTEAPTFLITINDEHALEYCNKLLSSIFVEYYADQEKEADVNVFCFEDYEQAFSYLTYLKEGR